MALAIHYSGRIRNYALIPELVDEVRDICAAFDWRYKILNEENLNGICVLPPGCEVMFLTFSPEGLLCSPVLIQYEVYPTPVMTAKTQYAGLETHRCLIKLFRHLENRYLEKMQLRDAEGRWREEDEEVLKKQFEIYNTIIDKMTEALRKFSLKGNPPTTLTDRLESFLKDRFGG